MPFRSLTEEQITEFSSAGVQALPGKRNPEFVLVCEHASCHVPYPWQSLGLEQHRLEQHIGWDIGAAAVTERLSSLLSVPAFLAGYSRLFVECNRMPHADDFVAPHSDGIEIPGNSRVCDHERVVRHRIAFEPFRNAVSGYLDGEMDPQHRPVMVSVHSFTPSMNGADRPWPIGVLWKGCNGYAERVADEFALREVVPVGRNEPYDPEGCENLLIDHFAQPRNLDYVVLEIRNDLIVNDIDASYWASLAAEALVSARLKHANQATGQPVNVMKTQ
ncbi:N-formylglutamate amidohydrolase [Emcibacter nanhaiensis]|uniref:N-formylglutamate amidohydrolase n=1 Tax=Emcibacter nanhaiensis TaxID=1505037 RepID=A0A501PLL6_9PROT|nr:N-formylglutamate amidohydrolase [Emcibacter nanhaiensis]TPD60656.1 N-formylglutamate amidohydrolase [Emcibacter nanhaiensis]